jgi:hypothetical protein
MEEAAVAGLQEVAAEAMAEVRTLLKLVLKLKKFFKIKTLKNQVGVSKKTD